MHNTDLSGFRQAVELRDRCRAAAIAAGQRLEVPLSPVQANVAFDAMVDLIRGQTEELRTEVAELRQLFQMQWTRMGEATARWRAEDPEGRELIQPDLGDLLTWLMAAADQAGQRTVDTGLTDLYSALDFAKTTITMSSRDWSKSEDLAMLYGVLVGWDSDATGGDVDQNGGALAELAQRYGWTPDDVETLHHRHAAVDALTIDRIAGPPPEEVVTLVVDDHARYDLRRQPD